MGTERRTNVPRSAPGPSQNSPPTSSIRLDMLRNPFLPLSLSSAATPRPSSSISKMNRFDSNRTRTFTAEARAADPDLLLRGYERAALTLNFVRALVDGGFADLHHPEYWDLGFVKHAQLKDAYQSIVSSIGDALDFFEESGVDTLYIGQRRLAR